MQQLVQCLKEKQVTLASIESLTGGLFASEVAAVSGASKVLKGSLVTYQSSVKIHVLGVDAKLIEQYGVISKECAEAMVICGKQMFQSDIVVSCTGNAGPEVMDGKAVGLVYMGILMNDHIDVYEEYFTGDRNTIREQVCVYLKNKILAII